ncbi:ATP-binding cassette domain-containing protein [Companilactobacillus kedongensis]|uniref:ATP-binding cassette domain-containing protein n=1 Tax=Companilactobacillus kedongensis TaxID=2486004 RepID=UPI000F79B772|nr:ATP-binding cassette domain-containing protein [Companilactobacillus kedongensis]
MILISLQSVSKKVKNRILIDNATLSINQGDIATFEGINGSGKTILLKAILGLIKTTGTIKVNDNLILTKDKYPIKAGILIENPSLIDNMTAFQNLNLLAQLQENISNNDIIELLESLGLSNNVHQMVKKFSLGMKQKVGIAQALLGENPLIILDEPTNALDETSIDNLIKKIKELKNKNITFLVTSHDKELIRKISTRRFVVRNGAVNETI